MTWKPTARKLRQDTSGTIYQTVPKGDMKASFTLKVDEQFSPLLLRIAEQLQGGWSKADIIRLAVEHLDAELRGEVHTLPKLMKKEP